MKFYGLYLDNNKKHFGISSKKRLKELKEYYELQGYEIIEIVEYSDKEEKYGL